MMDKFLPQVAAVSTQQQHQQHHSQTAQASKSFSVSEEHRHYLKVFIQTYHNLPILWDTSLRDYTNRDKRAEAYQQLVPIYRYLKRDATLEDVKKKINTLRTNYRKELKVVEAARKEGNHYQPRCWTFYELDFLRNAEKFLAIDTSIIKHETSSTSSVYNGFNESSHTGHFLDNAPYGYLVNKGNTSPMSISEMFHKSFGHQNNNTNQHQSRTAEIPNRTSTPQDVPSGAQNNIGAALNPIQYHPTSTPTTANKRLKLSNPSLQNSNTQPDEMLSMACDYLSSTYPEEESIARTWTHKLKRLPKEQRLLAEKFINDILFEAESGSLHRGSMQLNALEPYVRFEESQNDDASQDKPQSPSTAGIGAGPNITQHLKQDTNEGQYHSPTEVKNLLIADGSATSASNETENNNSSTGDFSTYR